MSSSLITPTTLKRLDLSGLFVAGKHLHAALHMPRFMPVIRTAGHNTSRISSIAASSSLLFLPFFKQTLHHNVLIALIRRLSGNNLFVRAVSGNAAFADPGLLVHRFLALLQHFLPNALTLRACSAIIRPTLALLIAVLAVALFITSRETAGSCWRKSYSNAP